LLLPLPTDAVAIVLYSGLHLAASLAIGLAVAWLVAQAEGPPSQTRVAFIAIVAGFFVTIFGIGMISSPIRAVLPWWSVVVANGLAVVVAGTFLLRRHPGLLRRLTMSSA
jgi:hypothetical protein